METRHLHHWTTHAYYQNKGTAGNRTRLMSFADSMTPRVTVPIEPLRRVELRSPGYEQGIVSTTTSRAYSIVGMTGVEPALSGVQGRRLTIKPSSRLYRKNESACDRNRTCIPWMATRHLHHWTTHAYYQNKGTAGNRTRLMSFADSMTPRVTVPKQATETGIETV